MLAQHRDYLKRLRGILEIVETTGRPDTPEFEQVCRALEELFRDLRAHELAEDALLDRLVDQDIRRRT